MTFFYGVESQKFGRTFRYFRCDNCRHIIVDPILSEKELFEDYDYEPVKIGGAQKKVSGLIFHSPLYHFFFGSKRFVKAVITKYRQRYHKDPKTYLDFGSGNGLNLAYFHELLPAATCIGYERATDGKRFPNTSIRVLQDLTEVKKRKYDIITLFHVLEHIADLEGFAKVLRAIADEHTVLYFQIPYADSLDMKLIHQLKSDFTLHTPYHTNIFSLQSLKQYFQDHGFEVTSVNWEVYQIGSIVMNQNIVVKTVLFLPLLVLGYINKLTKTTPYISLYVKKIGA